MKRASAPTSFKRKAEDVSDDEDSEDDPDFEDEEDEDSGSEGSDNLVGDSDSGDSDFVDKDAKDDDDPGEAWVDEIYKTVPLSRKLKENEAHDISKPADDKYLDMNEEPISQAKYAYLAYSFHLLIQLLLPLPAVVFESGMENLFDAQLRADVRKFNRHIKNEHTFQDGIKELLNNVKKIIGTGKTSAAVILNNMQHARKIKVVPLDLVASCDQTINANRAYSTCAFTNERLASKSLAYMFFYEFEGNERRIVFSKSTAAYVVAFMTVINIERIIQADIVKYIASLKKDILPADAIYGFFSSDPRRIHEYRFRNFMRNLKQLSVRTPSFQMCELFKEEVENTH